MIKLHKKLFRTIAIKERTDYMNSRKRNLYYIMLSGVIFLISIIIFAGSYSYNSSPAGKAAGRLNISQISVSINNQLIPSYDFKSGVYIAAEDLQLFGFEVTKNKEKHSIKVISPENSSINTKYLPNLSQLEEEEKVFYPTNTVKVDEIKTVSYATKEYTLIPVNILDSLGECSKQANSSYIYCELYK